MAFVVDDSACVGCGACEGACPTGAIKVEGTASINPDDCVSCGACAGTCPCGAINEG